MILQFTFQKKTYILEQQKKFLSVCILFFILFCLLGMWQFHRYAEKKKLITTYDERVQALPKPFAFLAGSLDELEFQPVAVEGEFENKQTILVQNRFYQQQLGFEVLTPLRIVGQKKWLLVDRGWIKKPANQMIPFIDDAIGIQHITGYIKRSGEYQFTLGKNILEPNTRPLVIQKIDVDEISHITHQTYYPYILRLDASQPNGYIRDWIISTTVPERHRMYAIQWYAMAIMIMIAYIGFCIREKVI